MTQHTPDRQAALRRTAILLSTLDAATSRRLLSQLPPLKRATLKRVMTELSDVDPLERRQAMQHFLQSASQSNVTEPHAAGAKTPPANHLSGNHLSGDGPTANGTAAAAAADASPLSFLGSVPDHVLLGALEGEHPQTIALVLASIQPTQAGRLLPRLAEETRNAAMQRLARLDDLPPDALNSISEHLKQLVADATPSGSSPTGSRTLAAIMEQVPVELQSNLQQVLGWSPAPVTAAAGAFPGVADPATPTAPGPAAEQTQWNDDAPAASPGDYDSASPESFVPEIDVAELDESFQRLRPVMLRDALAQLEGRQALLAVCGLPTRVADRVLDTLPRRQAKKIRQQLQRLDSITLEDIDHAKATLAERLGILPAASSSHHAPPAPSLMSAA